MVKPIDPKAVHDFVTTSDKERDEPGNPSSPLVPKADATIWPLGTLTKRERMKVSDVAAYVAADNGGLSDLNVVQTRQGSTNYWLVKLGLRKPRNFATPWSEEPHPLDAELHPVPTDAFLDTIPHRDFNEIAAEIDRLSTMTEDDAGESSPQS